MATQKPTSPIKASTQAFVEIEDIKDDIVLLKDNSAVVVLEVGAVNFWLLSAEEQNSIIYSYGNLLNSLSFPVQILILSKKMDISSYLEYLAGRVSHQQDDLIKKRLLAYREYIKNIIKKTTVLEKRFFFIVPFNPLEMGVTGANTKFLHKEYVLSRAKASLYPKRDTLLRLLLKIGLRATTMHQQALVELYFNLYNVSATGRQLAPIETYTDVIMSS